MLIKLVFTLLARFALLGAAGWTMYFLLGETIYTGTVKIVMIVCAAALCVLLAVSCVMPVFDAVRDARRGAKDRGGDNVPPEETEK